MAFKRSTVRSRSAPLNFFKDFQESVPIVSGRSTGGGSWFNNDEITFGSQGLSIINKNLLTTENVQVPYAKVKEISFKEGKYINSMTISYDSPEFFGGKTVFHIKKRDSLQLLKDYVYSKSGNFSVVDSKSILKSLSEPSKREKLRLMMSITKVRKEHPEYNDMTDDELSHYLHKKCCCSEIPYEEFSEAFLKRQN